MSYVRMMDAGDKLHVGGVTFTVQRKVRVAVDAPRDVEIQHERPERFQRPVEPVEDEPEPIEEPPVSASTHDILRRMMAANKRK